MRNNDIDCLPERSSGYWRRRCQPSRSVFSIAILFQQPYSIAVQVVTHYSSSFFSIPLSPETNTWSPWVTLQEAMQVSLLPRGCLRWLAGSTARGLQRQSCVYRKLVENWCPGTSLQTWNHGGSVCKGGREEPQALCQQSLCPVPASVQPGWDPCLKEHCPSTDS